MIVELSARKLAFPRLCPCCGAVADGEIKLVASRTTGKRVIHTTSHAWNFPYCSRCLAHVSAWEAVGAPGLIVLAILLALGGLAIHVGMTIAVIVLAIVVINMQLSRERERVRGTCPPECLQPDRAVKYLGWNGSVQTFDVASPQFAAAFVSLNSGKLINDTPELRSLVASQRERPAAPRLTAPVNADDELLKWVSKIESLKGPAARRTALEAALMTISRPELRDRLLLEASRIEVQAALDKADSLKTPAAKRRTLRAALDALLSDKIPDELQAPQIQMLEAALRELEE